MKYPSKPEMLSNPGETAKNRSTPSAFKPAALRVWVCSTARSRTASASTNAAAVKGLGKKVCAPSLNASMTFGSDARSMAETAGPSTL